jgi:hypothetical protein
MSANKRQGVMRPPSFVQRGAALALAFGNCGAALMFVRAEWPQRSNLSAACLQFYQSRFFTRTHACTRSSQMGRCRVSILSPGDTP